MTQKEIKQKKFKITEEELESRFRQIDQNGDGVLSANQITKLLQGIGYEDTYVGTMKKICRYLNKEKKIRQEKALKQQKGKDASAKQKQKKEIDNKNQQQQKPQEPGITFEQFKQYFQILQKPIGKMLFKTNIQRRYRIAAITKQVNLQNMLQKDKGQKINIKLLVGQQRPSYNSSINLKLWKELKNKKNQNAFVVEIKIKASSEENAKYLASSLRSVYDMIIEMASAENDEFEEVKDIIVLEDRTEGELAIFKVTTQDENFMNFLRDCIGSLDETLQTEISFIMKVLFQFNFNLEDLKNNPTSTIEQLLTHDCNINISYSGSQFLDALKQIIIANDLLQILKYDADPTFMMLLGFFSLEKGDFELKFKNLEERSQNRAITQELIATMGAIMNDLETPQFSFRKMSEIVDGPIMVNVQAQNVFLSVNVNVKDILKVPYYGQQGQQQGGYDSD